MHQAQLYVIKITLLQVQTTTHRHFGLHVLFIKS